MGHLNNAAYNERNFVLKKIPKDAMWGDVLKYQSKYVDGKLVGGCDIVRAMHARGELAPLLKADTAS